MAAASEAPLFAEVPVDHCIETSTFVVQRRRNFMPLLRRFKPSAYLCLADRCWCLQVRCILRGEDVEDPAGPREVPVAMAGAINGPEPLAYGELPLRHFCY
jgi:hypothetical protein